MAVAIISLQKMLKKKDNLKLGLTGKWGNTRKEIIKGLSEGREEAARDSCWG